MLMFSLFAVESSDSSPYIVAGLIALAVYAAVCGGCGAYCSTERGRGGVEGFWLGLLLGPFGVIAAACLPEIRPAPAASPAKPQPGPPAMTRPQPAAPRDPAPERITAGERYRELAAADAARTAARRAERDAGYRARGVEPGPWAWFRVLPDLAQAGLWGLAIAVPAGGILVVVIRSLS